MDTTEAGAANPKVKVVGNNPMHNELLVSFLRAETGLNCSHCSSLQLPDMLKEKMDEPTLFLLDSQNTDLFVLLDCFNTSSTQNSDKRFIAAFNLDTGMEIDKEALDHGLQGIFSKNEPLEFITKGVLAIFGGDYWYSRKTLSKYLWSQRSSLRLKGQLSSELTTREKEILLKIYSGACNKEIADDLNISFHTVKTHVYNIFRKLDVNSRFQATLWAAKYL